MAAAAAASKRWRRAASGRGESFMGSSLGGSTRSRPA
jgi:hypothetical protein